MRIRSSFNSEEIPAFPELKVELVDPLSHKSIEIRPKIDTGFAGSVLVGLDDYSILGLQLHEDPEKGVIGRLASGATISLRMSQAILKVSADESINCNIYTTPLLTRPLIGRQLLNSWRVVLDGPRNTLDIET